MLSTKLHSLSSHRRVAYLPIVEQKFIKTDVEVGSAHLPAPFLRWFTQRGWSPRAHQLELLSTAQAGKSVLLIAPTGAGKTLAGFLPSLVDLHERGRPAPGSAERLRGVHTLYISPLKALATDIERNLKTPVEGIGLPVDIQTRTGDTPVSKRKRQKSAPPDILLTTPEQLALLLSHGDSDRFFGGLRYVVLDELHSLVTSKRGHLLSLGLARLRRIHPDLQTIGLSATVAWPDDLRRWLVAQDVSDPPPMSEIIEVAGGAKPNIQILKSDDRVPWAGHSAKYALPEVMEAIKRHQTTILFVNTRSQAESLFAELWKSNEDSLPIALHHGSLDVGQRRRVEAAMQAGSLRAIVATSTLDLGIDWGDVDLVVHVGAPKGASRLAQRIGRSNHRMDEPSEAILVPANRFEVMECEAALEANYLGHQDTPPLSDGALDVLCQHILGMACADPFDAAALYDEITSAAPYQNLDWETFEQAVDFVATGGYALRAYDRYAKIRRTDEGLWRVANPRTAQQYRMNIGTIVAANTLTIRLIRARRRGPVRGGFPLGTIEEAFLESLTAGDTFIFAGRTVRFEAIVEQDCLVTDAETEDPRIPNYGGSKFPLTTYLAEVVRGMLADPERWKDLPDQVADWLRLQEERSVIPPPDRLLIETFPRGRRHYLVAYAFEGRLAHQTLGMLLTRRMERAGARPLGFVASDYTLCIWAHGDLTAMIEDGSLDLGTLFDEDMLGDDLEAWLDESFMLKRTFRNCALIAGLIERRHPGQEKSGRQVTISTDLVYDVLRTHEPDHIVLKATRQDAATGLLDVRRVAEMLSRIRGRIMHKPLDRISPLAVPIMMEIGRERVAGGTDPLLSELAEELEMEAFGIGQAPSEGRT
ncbi:ligase-associated DNA damage response DEXH box helicase [Notoacmeibacter sp. MSK16QG-6]|uniref:ligase-associated DNA damage response DEXH box helicase n=1 Tax=Notoacmeibacter sp. MSK16QG-6 TaxID=2957982 RepID=UPI0020A11748|nr:ligase-associated DNA damage response DEXH box helicase [Notoacmeibacter sp. MSK16QG-6]MCP1198636.1 ligase-associated DNA damage response DEXH box helicase [Notoacmeibacter sp. MSK16QG-6]